MSPRFSRNATVDIKLLPAYPKLLVILIGGIYFTASILVLLVVHGLIQISVVNETCDVEEN